MEVVTCSFDLARSADEVVRCLDHLGIRNAKRVQLPLLVVEGRDSGRAGDRLASMKVLTYEAIVERGEVKLPETVRLPEHAKVYVVVPGVEDLPPSRIQTPRLLRPEQVSDFAMETLEGEDATVR